MIEIDLRKYPVLIAERIEEIAEFFSLFNNAEMDINEQYSEGDHVIAFDVCLGEGNGIVLMPEGHDVKFLLFDRDTMIMTLLYYPDYLSCYAKGN